MFALSASGRILQEGSPDNSPGPRLCLAGCAGGNIVRLRDDVDDEIASEAQALTKAEPPWSDPSVAPHCLVALVKLLSPAEPATPALIYRLPNGLAYDTGATIIRGDSADGEQLLTRLSRRGMPTHLTEAGFTSRDDFWAPWCAAMEAGEIAAMAFAARLSARGADVGVYTFPGFRGRGLAAAVTANWSSLPSLRDRALFYSTHTTNRSSQRVAARLGLRRIGVSIRIT
jgi:hypothetical protein